MRIPNIDSIYSNGSSLTAGGGLYHTNIKNEYKKLYNVYWEDEKKVTYPQYIADYFECSLTHDGQSGSGAPRLIRRTYEHIQKIGIDKARKTLFLFEITDPIHRIDFYSNKIDDYMVVNVRYDNDGEMNIVSAHHTISPTDCKYPDSFFKGEIEQDLWNYFEKYHNPIVYTNKFKGELVGLFTFLEFNNIPYFYMFENDTLKSSHKYVYDILDKKRKVILEDEGCHSSSHFCHRHKLTIKDELNGFTEDTHPGYFGYKKFGETLNKFIESRLQFI
jgi:hypothetical protein